MRNLRYRVLNCEIHDWVQLPTKEEMDAWREKHEKLFTIKVVTSVIVTPTKEQVYENERLDVRET